MEDWDDCVGPAAKSKSVVGKTASSTATVAKAGASKRKLEQSTLPASSDKMPRLPARAAQSEAKSSVPKAKAGQKPCQEGVVAKLPRGQTAVSTSQDKKQRELQIPSPGFFVPMTRTPVLVASVCTGWATEAQAMARLHVPYRQVFACDCDPAVKAFLESNLPMDRYYDNVHDQAFQQARYADIFVAGPPCQPWSPEGSRLGSEDSRSTVMVPILNYIDTRRPLVFILEQVPGWMTHANSDYKTVMTFLRNMKSADGKAAYNVHERKLNAMAFGLPQRRIRVYVVGISCKLGYEDSFPVVHEQARPAPDLFSVLEKGLPDKIPTLEELPRSVLRTETTSKNLAKALAHIMKKDGGNPFASLNIVDVGQGFENAVVTKGFFPTLTVSRCTSLAYFNLRLNRFHTARELCRSQGMDPQFFNLQKITEKNLLHMCGNAMAVNVVASILEAVLPYFFIGT